MKFEGFLTKILRNYDNKWSIVTSSANFNSKILMLQKWRLIQLNHLRTNKSNTGDRMNKRHRLCTTALLKANGTHTHFTLLQHNKRMRRFFEPRFVCIQRRGACFVDVGTNWNFQISFPLLSRKSIKQFFKVQICFNHFYYFKWIQNCFWNADFDDEPNSEN